MTSELLFAPKHKGVRRFFSVTLPISPMYHLSNWRYLTVNERTNNFINISDPDFYDIVCSQTRVNKQQSFRYCSGSPRSMHSTPEKDLHQKCRAALASYFSRRQVLNFTPYIQICVDKLCHRLNNEYNDTVKAVKLDDVFAAFTTDIITYHAFARLYDFLNYPDFATPFMKEMDRLFDSVQICAHFPWLIPFMDSLPKFVSDVLLPSMVPFFSFREVSVNCHMCFSETNATVLICNLQEIKTLRYVKSSTATMEPRNISLTKQTNTLNTKQSSRGFFTPV